MTLGYTQRALRQLEDRVTILETGGVAVPERKPNGSALTDEQTKQINAIAEQHAKTSGDRAFNRLVTWAALSAFAGGAAVVGAYLKLHGG
jgi:hypothetical protein